MKYVLLFIITAVLLFPLYWMFTGSLQDIVGLMRVPPSMFPLNASLANYHILLRYSKIGLWSLNAGILFLSTLALSLTTSALAGYAFAMFRFRFKSVFWWAFLMAIMIPRQTMLIPLFVTVKNLGLSGTRAAAVFPLIFSPVGILLAANYVKTLPPHIIDGARIDGAGELTIVAKIIVPLCKPLFAALAIFASLGSLTDYLWQNLTQQDPERWTLVVGVINTIYGQRGGATDINLNPIGLSLAGGVLLFLPMLTVFLSFQRYFIAGIATGGAKE